MVHTGKLPGAILCDFHFPAFIQVDISKVYIIDLSGKHRSLMYRNDLVIQILLI